MQSIEPLEAALSSALTALWAAAPR
jgi:hypothetical protein